MITQSIEHPKAYWTAQNPILGLGIIGSETDSSLFKIGDALTAWNSLAYNIPSTMAKLPNYDSTFDNQSMIQDADETLSAKIVTIE